MALSKAGLNRLVHIFKLVASRSVYCLRSTLTFIRWLFSLLQNTKGCHTRRSQAKETSTPHVSSNNACYSSVPQALGPSALPSPFQQTDGIDDTHQGMDSGPQFLVAAPGPSSLSIVTIPSNPLLSPQSDGSRQPSPVPGSTKKRKKSTKPFAPEDVQRYQKHARASRKSKKPNLGACLLNYNRPDNHGWERCMHPEGALYFYSEQDGKKRTNTDSNIDDAQTRELVLEFARILWHKANKDQHIRNWGSIELVLSVSWSDDRDICQYYFVSHDDLVVFWLEDFVTDSIFYNVKGVEAIDHIKLAIQTQYWAHCELYPNHVIVKESVVEELRGILLHAASEAILSDGSLIPLPFSELQSLLGLMTTPFKDNQKNKYLTWLIGRLMRLFMRIKFMNFFGQASARLNADQSLYSQVDEGNQPQLSSLIRVLDPILFGAPSAHVKQLRRIWVDRTINALRWRSFIDTLFTEWNGFTIYSTVMLAVDVSFLSIPEMNGSHTPQIIAQVAVYFSTLSAVGSLLASVLLSNQIREQKLQSADLAAAYMLRMAGSPISMDFLGIMFSIPFALIMWGMIFFVCGLSVVVFGSGVMLQRIIAVPFWLLVALLASWPAWYAGERWLVWTRKEKKLRSDLLPMSTMSSVGVDP
ncbi:hypothetical protein F5I97DRAFT_1850702 [Phlebopus sp. FC_14]|nr:hypothetical protein F5I97DRAFT_1850702 [Phlebopus sp. FC_14]